MYYIVQPLLIGWKVNFAVWNTRCALLCEHENDKIIVQVNLASASKRGQSFFASIVIFLYKCIINNCSGLLSMCYNAGYFGRSLAEPPIGAKL